MACANTVPEIPKKKQRRTFLIVKKSDGSYCTLRNNSEELVHCSHKSIEKRRKQAVPYFVALKGETDCPRIAEVVGKASDSDTAATLLESFNKPLMNTTTTDSGITKDHGGVNWKSDVFVLILLGIIGTVFCVAAEQLDVKTEVSNLPDEYLGVWKMSNTSNLKSYFHSNSAKRYIPHDIPKYLDSKALPVIIIEKGNAPGQITMKRFWVDNVMEKVNIPLNTEFIYQGFENYLFLEKFVYQNNTLVHEFQFINGNDKIEGIKFTEMFTKNGINQIVAKHDDSNLPYKVTYVKVQMED